MLICLANAGTSTSYLCRDYLRHQYQVHKRPAVRNIEALNSPNCRSEKHFHLSHISPSMHEVGY